MFVGSQATNSLRYLIQFGCDLHCIVIASMHYVILVHANSKCANNCFAGLLSVVVAVAPSKDVRDRPLLLLNHRKQELARELHFCMQHTSYATISCKILDARSTRPSRMLPPLIAIPLDLPLASWLNKWTSC